jgi:hypothetical protein
LDPGAQGEEDGNALLSRRVKALGETILAENRLHDRGPAARQMDEEIDLPIHRVLRAVAMVELQGEIALCSCDGDHIVDRSGQMPQFNIVEVVAAGHLQGECQIVVAHPTLHRARHTVNANGTFIDVDDLRRLILSGHRVPWQADGGPDDTCSGSRTTVDWSRPFAVPDRL